MGILARVVAFVLLTFGLASGEGPFVLLTQLNGNGKYQSYLGSVVMLSNPKSQGLLVAGINGIQDGFYDGQTLGFLRPLDLDKAWTEASETAGKRITGLALSPDNRYLVVATPTGGVDSIITARPNLVWGDSSEFSFERTSLHVLDPVTLHLLIIPMANDLPEVYSMAFSQDGKKLVVADGLGGITVWYPPNFTATFASAAADMIALSPDGRLAIPAGFDTVYAWDTGKRRWSTYFKLAHPGQINAAAFSPDGMVVATGGNDGSIRLWDLSIWSEPSLMATLNQSPLVDVLAFSPDGKKLISGGLSGISTWDIHDPRQITLIGHENAWMHGQANYGMLQARIVFYPDGKHFVVVRNAKDEAVALWGPPPIPTSVAEENIAKPARCVLRQNYPNPFNPETAIGYDLPEASDIRLAIYDLSGRKVRALVEGRQTAGSHISVWNGKDNAGKDVASGVYLCRLEAGLPTLPIGQAGKFVQTKKMVLVR